jgi:hypothetical protein
VAGRRGHRWTGRESPWFDVFVVVVLVVDIVVEGMLAILDRLRRVARHAARDDLIHARSRNGAGRRDSLS